MPGIGRRTLSRKLKPYFYGFEYFQHEFPLEPTTLVMWRRRVGAACMERLLEATIQAADPGRHEMRRINQAQPGPIGRSKHQA